MMKTEKKEERAQYSKKDTYTYEEVRSMIEAAIEDRARYLGFFYKVMPGACLINMQKRRCMPMENTRLWVWEPDGA